MGPGSALVRAKVVQEQVDAEIAALDAGPVAGTIEIKIWAEMIGVHGKVERRELVVARRDRDHSKIKDFGLTLEEGKSILQH
jgi:hypothetical protein